MRELRPVSRFLGRMLTVVGIGVLVYFPAMMTGEQNARQRPRPLDDLLGPDFELTPWQEFALGGSFGVTTSIEPVSSTNAAFNVLVGSNPGSGNVYRIAHAAGIPSSIDPSGSFRLKVTATEPFTLSPTLPALNGACCAAPFGDFEGTNSFRTLVTRSGFDTQEVTIGPQPPYTVTFTDLGVGSHLSGYYQRTVGLVVASTYNTSTGQVQVFTRPPQSSVWTLCVSVTCDSPFNNAHWWQTSSPDGSKSWIICRDGGPVEISQIDLATGIVDWTIPVDSEPPPAGFTYQILDFAGEIRLPGGGTGNGLAYVSPGNTEIEVGMVAPVGGPSPPVDNQFAILPGDLVDRHGLSADGPIVTFYSTDPDHVGSTISLLNFGNLSAVPTIITFEDNSRTPLFTAIPNDTIISTNIVREVLADRTILLSGTATNLAIDAAGIPFDYNNQENGTLSTWDQVQQEPLP